MSNHSGRAVHPAEEGRSTAPKTRGSTTNNWFVRVAQAMVREGEEQRCYNIIYTIRSRPDANSRNVG